MFRLAKFFIGDQLLIASIDKVIEDFRLGSFGDTNKARELTITVTSEPLGNIRRTRSRGIRQLVGIAIEPLELRALQVQIDL